MCFFNSKFKSMHNHKGDPAELKVCEIMYVCVCRLTSYGAWLLWAASLSLWGPLQLPDLFPLVLIGSERHGTPPSVEPDPASHKFKWAFSLPRQCVFDAACMSLTRFCQNLSTFITAKPLGSFWVSLVWQMELLLCVQVVKWDALNGSLVKYSNLCKYSPHAVLTCWRGESGILEINILTAECVKLHLMKDTL